MKKYWWIVGLVVVVAVIVFAYSSRPTTGTIRIAALLSLSGNASAWGQNSQRAIELATAEINAKGGINGKQVVVDYEDTAGDPKRAVLAFEKVTSVDHVTAVIGPLNQSEDVPVMPLIDQGGVPTIIPGFVSMQDRKNLTNPILVWSDAPTEAGRMAQYAYSQGIRTIGVVGTLDAWEDTVSKAFAQKFQSLGGTVTKEEIVQPTEADMKLPVTEILATHPQAVFLGTYYQFINSTKSLHDLGYKGKVFSIEVDDYLAGQTQAWSQGTQFVAPDFYTSSFIDDFKAKYNMTPGLPAGQSYDAANILFSFLKQSTNQAAILQIMKNFHSYDGVSGQLQITSDGRTILPTALFEIEVGGTIKRVSGLN